MEEIFVGHDGRMDEIRMEVGRVGVDCVVVWACQCFYVLLGTVDKYGGWEGGE